jgi:hypothetical protein
MATPLQRVRRLLQRMQQDQLEDLVVNRHIFQQFEEATKKHVGTDHSTELAEWMAQCYVGYASTAIRRMVEPPPTTPKPKTCANCGHTLSTPKPKPESSVSLVILLEELKKHPALLTRQRFLKMCKKGGPVAERFADQWFDKIVEQQGAASVPTAVIDQDIATLKQQTKQVKRLVNKLVAHTEMDRRRIGTHRYGDLNSAVKVLSEVYRKYALLIEGKEPTFPLDDFDVSEDFAKLWP